MHCLQIVFPNGMVTGWRKGYEQFGHCMILMICLASRVASSGSFGTAMSIGGSFDEIERDVGDGRVSAALSGKGDDMDASSSKSRDLRSCNRARMRVGLLLLRCLSRLFVVVHGSLSHRLLLFHEFGSRQQLSPRGGWYDA